MAYTSHGHAYGIIDTDQPRPTVIARCGGPRLCKTCSREAATPQPAAQPGGPDQSSPAEQVARAFHEEYERLAPYFGYETRQESAVPWEQVPEQNRALMIAVAGSLLGKGTITRPDGTVG